MTTEHGNGGFVVQRRRNGWDEAQSLCGLSYGGELSGGETTVDGGARARARPRQYAVAVIGVDEQRPRT